MTRHERAGGFSVRELQWDHGIALLPPAQAPEGEEKREGHP